MRTITAYLLEYTLVNHCGSNKSEFARRLGMRRNDFCRIYDRCMTGEGSSLTALEAILRLYFAEGYSLDEALCEYVDEAPQASENTSCAMCKEYPRQLRERLSGQSKAADQRAQMFRSADQFLAQVERVFCTEACGLKAVADSDCPCKQLCGMVECIMTQLNIPTVSK